MKLKDKVKSYSFWISLGSAIILILNLIGNKFGFNIDSGFASDLLTSLCSILVLLGIIVTPTSSASTTIQQTKDDKNKPDEIETIIESETTNQVETASEELLEETNNENLLTETKEEFFENENIVFEQNNPVELLKSEIVNKNVSVFNGREIPTNEYELNIFFENEKEKFKADLDIYIESLKQEILSKNQKTE